MSDVPKLFLSLKRSIVAAGKLNAKREFIDALDFEKYNNQ